MTELGKFITDNVVRGACQCGKCIDPGQEVEHKGHTANPYFFDVSLAKGSKATSEKLIKLIEARGPAFGEKIDLMDGKEHSYIEIGGWIGDQGLALTLMGLGELLDIWQLITPKTIFGKAGAPKETLDDMAGSGLITIIARKDEAKA